MRPTKLHFLLLCIAFISCGEEPAPAKKPWNGEKEEGVLRFITYNVFTFRMNPEIYPNGTYEVIADMMKEFHADALLLNELDEKAARTKNIDQAKYMAELMGGWSHYFTPALKEWGGEGWHGMGMVTRDAPVKTDSFKLPQGDGDPRMLCVMEMEDYVLILAHLNHTNRANRLLQADAINKYVEDNYSDCDKPIILGGDLNDGPNTETLNRFRQKWDVVSPIHINTSPASNPKACIDYFLVYRNDAKFKVVRSQVMRMFKSGDVTKTSDHLPVMVDIRITE